MSTRRLFLPVAQEVTPVWIYGGPNNGGIWQMAGATDNTLVLLSADQYWQAAPGIYLAYGDGGKAYATTDAAIMPPSAVEAQGMAMLIKPDGTVNSSLFGTFVSPNNPSGLLNSIGTIGGVAQYASLPTSMAMITITGVRHLLVSGLFSFYIKAGLSYTATGIAAIDLTTGLINTGFTGAAFTFNSGFSGTAVFPLKVYSDGDTNFGIYSIGNAGGVGNGPITNIDYFYSFAGALPTGAGTFLNLDGGGLTPPVGTYGGTPFNGPFPLTSAGAIGTPFPSTQLALCPPASLGSGVFMQDSLIVRPDPDPPASGTVTGTVAITTGAITAGVFAVTITTGPFIATPPTSIFVQGGTTGAQATISTAVVATMVAAFAAALYPECSFTFVSTGTAPLVHVVITFTMPSGSTYYPFIAMQEVNRTGSGWSRAFATGTTGISSALIALQATDGSYLEYIDLFGLSGTYTLLSTAIAWAGGLTCYVYAVSNLEVNLEWSIKLLGGIRINIGLTGATNSSGSGKNPLVNLTATCPVSVIPFNGGFAVAVPYLPRFGFAGGGVGTPAAPVTYQANRAVASAPTVTLKCPIIVINSSGVIDTAFDAALWTNFFSLARTDGARFGPMSLATDNAGNLYFGSMYIPTYLDPAIGAVTQTTVLGDVTPIPVWNPLTAGGTGLTAGAFSGAGDGLEVLCACDITGAIVQPA